MNDVRIIAFENLDSLFTWVDESYTAWDNMKIKTGVCMSMGWGIIHAKYRKL